jgi:hypothetical protein
MKLRNKIVNYFAIPPFHNEGVRVVRSKFSLDTDEAKLMLANLFRKEKKSPLPPCEILQVFFDADSGMIYTPNAREFSNETLQELLVSVKYKISIDFGNYSNRAPIEANPYESLRVRSLESFGYANKMIQEHFNGIGNIPIIEANLSRMSETIKQLPEKYVNNSNAWGGYVSNKFAEFVTFLDDEKGFLHHQTTPFILINTSNSIGATEKEWVILDSYHEYSKLNSGEKESSAGFTIKRLLYMGWTFEEVSRIMLENAENIAELFRGIASLVAVVKSLDDDKFAHPYYITFKIDERFPIKLDSIWDKNTGSIDLSKQYEYLQIIDYDLTNSCIMLKTPVYIPHKVCKKIFNPVGEVFAAQYNPTFHSIDIKYGIDFKDKRQKKKIKGLIEKSMDEGKGKLDFSSTLRAQGQWAVSPLIFNKRKISDYGYATDFIKNMCRDNGVPFKDFSVVVGSIEQFFGRGVQGGFMDIEIFKQNKMTIPFHMTEDIYIEPPVIFVNSVEHPSYPEQTEVLIHEYRHYIYGIMNPDYKIGYTVPQGSDDERWDEYLTDPNEVEAHKSEIKFGLRLGKSFDEIIRSKVGGIVTRDNYPIAVKFSKLVKEVMNNIEAEDEKNEELA